MKLEIVSKKENPMLERTEVVAKISGYDATPSNVQVGQEIAKAMKSGKEKVFVLKIGQRYGNASARVQAQVYATPEALAKSVHKKRMLRTQPKTEKKAGTPKNKKK